MVSSNRMSIAIAPGVSNGSSGLDEPKDIGEELKQTEAEGHVLQEQSRDEFLTSQRPAKILVVDDEPIVRRFVVATLESRDFLVVAASSGQEGLKFFSEHKDVELVLSDILMPAMSGPEMVQRIVKLDPSVKIMFMTGTDPDRRLLELSAKKYLLLHKPFPVEILISSVQECLAS